MKKAIFGFIYFKMLGWKAVVNVPDYDKYIICAAPTPRIGICSSASCVMVPLGVMLVS
jgi:hypothetical protein